MSSLNEANVGRALAEWNAGNLEGYLALYDENIRLHGYSPEPMTKPEVRGFYEMIHRAYDGPQLVFHDVFSAGDRVAIRFTMTGVHRGEFLGIAPTGRHIAVDGITILRFANGRCVERWSSVDRYAWLAQLGAAPPIG
ncbi:MAG: ester cyclase [Acidobacteria bacterium]|nr:ester cyclase [Acidobacteriota bacterium]